VVTPTVKSARQILETMENIEDSGMDSNVEPVVDNTTMQDSQSADQSAFSDTQNSSEEMENTGVEADGGDSATSQMIPRDRFDQIYGERNQLRDEIAQYREALARIQNDPQYREQMFGKQAVTQDPKVQNALKILKDNGIPTMQDIEKKFEEREMLSNLRTQINEMEKKYDGKSGLPKFDRNEVVEHMKRYNMTDAERAYRDLYMDAIIDARVKQSNSKGRGMYSERPGGTRPITPNDADKQAALKKAVDDGNPKSWLERFIVPQGINDIT
jgi:hypothetical protein